LPDWIILGLFVAGVSLTIFGAWRWGLPLISLSIFRWLIWPLAAPFLSQAPLWLTIFAIPTVVAFGGILLLDKFVTAVYGEKAGGNVASEYLVRVFDGIGRLLIWFLMAPIRLVR